MNFQWYDWFVIVGGVMVVALVIFVATYTVRSRRFIMREKHGKQKRKTKN
jgi:heme exporter protein D